MIIKTTRRAVLAGLPAAVAVGINSSALGSGAVANDPVFAAIAGHKELCDRCGAAIEANGAIADELWQQAEFIAQNQTEQRAAYLRDHPEYSSHAEFRQPDDAVFCEYRSNAARELQRNNPEYQAALTRMQEAADAEAEAAIALAATTPTTIEGMISLAQYVTREEVKLALDRDERQVSTALLRTLAESVTSLVRV